MTSTQKDTTKLTLVLSGSLGALALYFVVLTTLTLPVANLVATFGIPPVVADSIIWAIEAGATVSTIISILATVATGGAGLIAATGSIGIKAYLKGQLTRLGRARFIAW